MAYEFGERRMAFTTDNDFEDGEWIDGEFYASKQKRGRQQTKDEQIYGIFTEDSDSDKRQAKKQRQTFKEVQFVSSGTAADEDEPKPGLGAEAPAEVPSATPSTTAGVKAPGLSNADFSKLVRGEDDSKPEESTRKPKRPVKLGHEFGKFERHTKGFGLKYLEKFNFKGRLGAKETGIAEPVAVKVRPGQMGLGFGNFREAAEMKQNKRVAADLYDEEIEDEEAAEPKAWMKDAANGEGGAGSSRMRKPKVKTVYRTAQELLKEKSGPQKQIIVDMTGDTARVVSSVSELLNGDVSDPEDDAAEAALHPHKVKRRGTTHAVGKELIHNVRMLCDMAEVDLQDCHRKLQHEQGVVSELRAKLENATLRSTSFTKSETGLKEVQRIVNTISGRVKGFHRDTMSARAAGELGTVTAQNQAVQRACTLLKDALDTFETVRLQYVEQFAALKLSALGPSILQSVLRTLCTQGVWDPLMASELLPTIIAWRNAFIKGIEHSEAHEIAALADGRGVNPLLARQGLDLCITQLDVLVTDIVMPFIRQAFTTAWHPRNSEPALQLILQLQQLVSGAEINSLLQQMIYTRIASALRDWVPLQDRATLSEWVLPWQTLLGPLMLSLWPLVRGALERFLVTWVPTDTYGVSLMRPFEGQIPERGFEQLVHRFVLPKLGMLLREYVIDPRSQDLAPLKAVIAWQSVLPPAAFGALIEGELLPKWFAVLQQWLQSGGDLREVAQWYVGWRKVLPPALFESDKARVSVIFGAALDMIRHAGYLANVVQPPRPASVPPPPLPPPAPITSTFDRVLAERRAESAVDRVRSDRKHGNNGSGPRKIRLPGGLSGLFSGRPGGGAPVTPGISSGWGGAPSAIPSTPPPTSSFKDFIEQYAMQAALPFLPHASRPSVKGKAVYSFGKVPVYFENGVVFADMSGNAAYAPIALPTLLSVAKSRERR